MIKNVRSLLLATTAFGFMLSGPAFAADSNDETIKALQAQMNALQKQLNELQAQQKAQAKAQAEAQAEAQNTAASSETKKEILPGVKLTVGGYIAADAIYRSKNETTDVPSSWSGIPLNGVNAHQSEFRGSARNTRITLLGEGNVDKDMKLSAYLETDFMGSGTTSTSTGTNSYAPRIRQGFAQIDRNDWGTHFTVGQAWTLLTLNKTSSMAPRSESTPNVSDGSYIPGFNYTRNTQFRVVQDLIDKKLSVGLSIESPQTSISGINVPTGVNVVNSGSSSTLNSGAGYSVDETPDVIAKVGFDPGWGHYEIFGIGRTFHDNITTNNLYHNNLVVGGGGGVGALVPVIKDKLDFRATFMAGQGIGRYGAGGLPDIAIDPLGGIHPLTQYTTLVGLIARPTPTWELYLYGGLEKVMQENQAGGYGWGSNTITGNSACVNAVTGSTGTTTTGNCQTSSIWQITPGFWKDLYKGNFGNLKVGAQYSLTRRNTFADSSGTAPHAYENIVITSFRYSPF